MTINAGGTTVPDSWAVKDSQGNYVRQVAPLDTQDMSFMWGGTGGTTTAAPAPASAGPANYADQAKGLYSTILGREGDAEGVGFWTDKLAGGMSLADATAGFKDSARTTLNDYLKTGESKYSTLLDSDLAAGADAGTFEDGMYQNALGGLESNVFTNLYGDRPGAVTINKATKSGVPAAFAAAPQFVDVAAERGPTAWNVDDSQRSAYQLEQILKSDSPLMQLARTRAQQDMARSGTQNSSMAGTAGEVGMIDRAQPFALQDASTYADSARANADAENTFARDANAFGREQRMANFNVTANDWAGDRSLQRNISMSDREFANQLQRDKLGHGYDMDLADLNNKSGSGSQEATLQRGYIQAINQARTDYSDKLAAISSSKDMDASLKASTMENLRVSYNTIIENYAKLLGWDAASWLITTSSGAASAGMSASMGGGSTVVNSPAWNAPAAGAGAPPADLYTQYKAAGGTLSPDDWYRARFGGGDDTGSGAGIGSSGIGGGDGNNGVAQGDW